MHAHEHYSTSMSCKASALFGLPLVTLLVALIVGIRAEEVVILTSTAEGGLIWMSNRMSVDESFVVSNPNVMVTLVNYSSKADLAQKSLDIVKNPENVSAVVCCRKTRETEILAGLFSTNPTPTGRIPIMAWGATGADLSDKRIYPNVARSSYAHTQFVAGFLAVLNSLRWDSYALLMGSGLTTSAQGGAMLTELTPNAGITQTIQVRSDEGRRRRRRVPSAEMKSGMVTSLRSIRGVGASVIILISGSLPLFTEMITTGTAMGMMLAGYAYLVSSPEKTMFKYVLTGGTGALGMMTLQPMDDPAKVKNWLRAGGATNETFDSQPSADAIRKAGWADVAIKTVSRALSDLVAQSIDPLVDRTAVSASMIAQLFVQYNGPGGLVQYNSLGDRTAILPQCHLSPQPDHLWQVV